MAKCKSCAKKGAMGKIEVGADFQKVLLGIAGALASRIVQNKMLGSIGIFQSNQLVSDAARLAAGLFIAQSAGEEMRPFGEGMAVEAGLKMVQGLGGAALAPTIGNIGGYAGAEYAGNGKPLPFPVISGSEYLGKGEPLPFPVISGSEYLGKGEPLPFPVISGSEYLGEKEELIIN